ncbi:purine-cytosine permease family protein [Streptomyces eurythermus]
MATTALGGIAYLADFAVGGSIAVAHGFSSALVAILAAVVVIFLAGIPISYYSAKYSIDMGPLTRGAGFGYLGSTLTSVICASFTFIFFALEGSVMAQALELGLHIPLAVGYVVCSLVILPLVMHGMTALSRMQVWTQPVWLVLMVAPFVSIAVQDPGKFPAFTHFAGDSPTGSTLGALGVGAGVALSLIAQIGEQVDHLRFMPDKTPRNGRRWWAAVPGAGPGWVVLGALKQIGGAFLAFRVAGSAGLGKADEPIRQYVHGFGTFAAPVALGLATFFVTLSQIKINSTNAYSGSLSRSNFFPRLTHRHPGRVVHIFLDVGIALALMEGGVSGFLDTVLGFYSNVAIAWIGAVVADLIVNNRSGSARRTSISSGPTCTTSTRWASARCRSPPGSPSPPTSRRSAPAARRSRRSSRCSWPWSSRRCSRWLSRAATTSPAPTAWTSRCSMRTDCPRPPYRPAPSARPTSNGPAWPLAPSTGARSVRCAAAWRRTAALLQARSRRRGAGALGLPTVRTGDGPAHGGRVTG